RTSRGRCRRKARACCQGPRRRERASGCAGIIEDLRARRLRRGFSSRRLLSRAGHCFAGRAVPRCRPLPLRHFRPRAALPPAVQMHAVGLLVLPRRRLNLLRFRDQSSFLPHVQALVWYFASAIPSPPDTSPPRWFVAIRGSATDRRRDTELGWVLVLGNVQVACERAADRRIVPSHRGCSPAGFSDGYLERGSAAFGSAFGSGRTSP